VGHFLVELESHLNMKTNFRHIFKLYNVTLSAVQYCQDVGMCKGSAKYPSFPIYQLSLLETLQQQVALKIFIKIH